MKVRISTVIDIPDDCLIAECKLSSAIQIIADDITRFVSQQHYIQAMEWCCKGEKGGKGTSDYWFWKHHEYWGKKCDKLKWEYQEIKED